jgi:homogentisate 1,2-dioxygenase
VHRLTDTVPLETEGDTVFGRKVLMFNSDVEMGICKPAAEAECFYRNGEGDEVLFIHEGSGELETVFGRLPFRTHDYVVIPRGTTYRVVLGDGPHTWLTFHTPGEIETPNRYRNRYGQLLENAPFSQRDFHPPVELETHGERGDFELVVRARGGYQHFTLDYHPFDVVGWDGYVYPYTFNIHDFEPKSGRIHQPPPVHQTFQGPNFVICSFCPRELDWDPEAVPVPYVHSNLQSEEVIYYVDGQFGSRKGVGVGAITLHPSGLPHGPQPGVVEKMLGKRRTDELAVMCDTFKPLKLTPLARRLDDPSYALSWHTPLETAEV